MWATTRISLQDLRPLASLFSEDLAIDLGTVNTRVYARGRGIVVNENSAVALDESTGEVRAVGKEAGEMLGRTPSKISVIKPLRDWVNADFRVTETMLGDGYVFYVATVEKFFEPSERHGKPPLSLLGLPRPALRFPGAAEYLASSPQRSIL